MSAPRRFFVVSVPLIVVRNMVVSAPGPDEAMRAAVNSPNEWFDKCLHSERIVGVYHTFDGVPTYVKELGDVGKDDPGDPDLGVLS